MTVKELIRQLQEQDPQAEVLFMAQPRWPFEYSIRRELVTRKELRDEGEDGDLESPETSPTDVFLVEGSQLRYGSKKAWDR